MTVRMKALLFIAVSLGGLTVALYLSSALIVQRGFARAERSDTVATVEATRKIIATMAEEFSQRSDDWADWDDTLTYLADGNHAYEQSNIVYGSFVGIGWDLFMVVRADGGPVVAVTRDRAAGKLVGLSPGYRPHLAALLRGIADHGPPIEGLALVDGHPMLLSSRAIRSTLKVPGAVAGRLITGRLIDAAWMQRLARFTFLDVTFIPTPELASAPRLDQQAASALAGGDGVHIAPRSDQTIAGWAYLRDLHGQPVILMRIDCARAIRAHGQRVLALATTALVSGGVLVGVLTLLLVGRVVLRPLDRLIAGVRSLEGGGRTRVVVASKDEFGELAGAFNQMAAVIVDREEALRVARAHARLVLDSTGEALITCSLAGDVDDDVSAAARAWFGPPAAGADLATYLAPADPEVASSLRLGLEQLAANQLPFELLVDQLPNRLQRDGRLLALSFRRLEDTATPGLLVVASDITAQTSAEAAEASAREAHEVIGHLLRDPAGFERFVDDTEATLAQSSAGSSDGQRALALHTLKGNAAVYGLTSVAAAAHRLEDRVAAGAGADAARAALVLAWRTALARAAAHRRGVEAAVHVPVAEYDRFLHQLEQDADRSRLLRIVRSWRLEPADRVLSGLAEHARHLADDRGKLVDVVVDAEPMRIDVRASAGFWHSLVHVIRNAVVHGIDPAADRVAAGKPARGVIRLAVRAIDDGLCVVVSDDGAGIDWDQLVRRADQRGLALAGDRRLAALFADGVTSRDEVTEWAGRGVGLGAVRAQCEALGVGIEVTSTRGAGTAFSFTLHGVAVEREAYEPGPVALAG